MEFTCTALFSFVKLLLHGACTRLIDTQQLAAHLQLPWMQMTRHCEHLDTQTHPTHPDNKELTSDFRLMIMYVDFIYMERCLALLCGPQICTRIR